MKSSQKLDPHVSLLYPFALQNTVVFESLISVCRASLLLSQGKSIQDDREFVQHRGRALSALNAKLQTKDPTDDAALLSVSLFVILEVGSARCWLILKSDMQVVSQWQCFGCWATCGWFETNGGFTRWNEG